MSIQKHELLGCRLGFLLLAIDCAVGGLEIFGVFLILLVNASELGLFFVISILEFIGFPILVMLLAIGCARRRDLAQCVN